MTFRILEYIAKRHNQSLPKFLTEWSLQEYKEHEKKPFHKNLKKVGWADINTKVLKT